MDDAKQQLIDKLKSSNNILVSVSHDPSVDQLASCIALTLLLNKQGKHAAAVYSGKTPSALKFLKPEDTLEKNTDSLRDFIISLDKAKADKLRYKVEENVVRIFITPYRTSLSEDDLDFSEGDFNVDMVVALGVQKQEDLDEAITAHGRILHDATVTSINTTSEPGLGTINWHDPQASSLSELVTNLVQALDSDLLDGQIATALLTGIVSETSRFSNDKTSSATMSASAALMAAGANQQLVASELEAGSRVIDASDDDDTPAAAVGDNDGVLEIEHAASAQKDVPAPAVADQSVDMPPAPAAEPAPAPGPDVAPAPEPKPESESLPAGPKMMTEPPTLGGMLTANSESEHLDPVTDPMSLPVSEPPQILERRDHKGHVASDEDSGADAKSDDTPAQPSPVPPSPAPEPPAVPMPAPPPAWTPPPPAVPPAQQSALSQDGRTLTDIEESVHSPHIEAVDLDEVRDQVDAAINEAAATGAAPQKPIQALNARPLGDDLHPADSDKPAADSLPVPEPFPAQTANPATDTSKPTVTDPTAPPPVPPPIPFQFGNSPPSQ